MTLAFPVAVTCKLAKYFHIIGTQHKARHTTGPFMTSLFLVANLTATHKPQWLLVLSLKSNMTKGLYNISKNFKLVFINGYSKPTCNHYISEPPGTPTVKTHIIRPV